MNYSQSFVRKIIYISVIGFLLIPLSLVSRPATRDANNDVKDGGGQLSQLRDYHKLSQAKLMEIDPASETMKLASLGLRGVAVNLLWMQAIEHKKKENWDGMASTLNALIKVQPNFIKVWEYQAHNLSYNISVEFDDYEYRYHWVKKGIKFLTEGIPYNYRDHRMTDNLGFFTGMKIGRSDERVQFRRLFREDDQFREDMEDWVEPDSYFERQYGHDNWLMSYQWYDRSRDLVERLSATQHSGDMLFYMKRPAQLRNEAGGLQDEFRTGEIIKEVWRRANVEWAEYGQLPISNTIGIIITMEGLAEKDIRLAKLRQQLDALVPGAREELLKDVKKQANLTPEMEAALAVPIDQRDDEQAVLARRANGRIYNVDKYIDVKVTAKAKPEELMKAKRILDQIVETLTQMRTIDQYSSTVNYRYWKTRTTIESLDAAAKARAALYDASELKRKSIFDDEYEIDPKTRKKTIVQVGAISKYKTAFEQWKDILYEFKDLRQGELADDLMDAAGQYYQMLKVTGQEWPDDFPLQELVDHRAEHGPIGDELPTSEEIAERKSLEEDGVDEDEVESPADESSSSSEEENADSNGTTQNENNDATKTPVEEDPKTEDPKTEDPKTEDPKTEDPKTEDPKTEDPKTEDPKTEDPKTEDPKTEDPKTEDPKTEDPKTEDPKTEDPKTEDPKTEDPKTEDPKTEDPKTEDPKTEDPKTEDPKTEDPKSGGSGDDGAKI